jgi:hypothetical protein
VQCGQTVCFLILAGNLIAPTMVSAERTKTGIMQIYQADCCQSNDNAPAETA